MKEKNAKSRKFSESGKEKEFAVILEKIYAEIKVISESQRSLSDKLDTTIGKVTKNSEDIIMINLKIIGINDELTKINGKLAKMEEDIRIIKTDFGNRLTRLETSVK